MEEGNAEMGGKREPSRPKRTLSERAYHAIKNDILQGEVPEGTFLSEADVRQRHGVGRTPFREACNRLHHEGILEVVPRRGYLIPEMSFRDVRDMFEVRSILEGAIAELAALRGSAAQMQELDGLAAPGLTRAGARDDYERITKANTEFHLCLARMAQNHELLRLITSILEKSERLSYLELRGGRWDAKDIQNIHKPLVDAIRRRDAAAAREAVQKDIREGQLDIFRGAPSLEEGPPRGHRKPAAAAE
jgi:DNA-binding GntR family transcriptional regulator